MGARNELSLVSKLVTRHQRRCNISATIAAMRRASSRRAFIELGRFCALKRTSPCPPIRWQCLSIIGSICRRISRLAYPPRWSQGSDPRLLRLASIPGGQTYPLLRWAGYRRATRVHGGVTRRRPRVGKGSNQRGYGVAAAAPARRKTSGMTSGPRSQIIFLRSAAQRTLDAKTLLLWPLD